MRTKKFRNVIVLVVISEGVKGKLVKWKQP